MGVEIGSWVSSVADWASIASLVVSIYAAVTIAKVRREMVGRATLPGIISALEASIRTMTDLLGAVDQNWRPLELELARCEANLRSVMNTKLPAERRAKALLKEIDSLRKAYQTPRELADGVRLDRSWAIYASLNGMVEELKQISLRHQIGG